MEQGVNSFLTRFVTRARFQRGRKFFLRVSKGNDTRITKGLTQLGQRQHEGRMALLR